MKVRAAASGCATVWQCDAVQQCAAVRRARVCGSAEVCSSAAVCGSVRGSVRQCVAVCDSVRGIVWWQCALRKHVHKVAHNIYLYCCTLYKNKNKIK
jgi:hypothetical protein